MKKQRFIITFLIIAILFLFNINVYAEDILYGDTLSKKTIIMTIIGISLLLVGCILSLITIIEKRKKDKKVD